MALFSNQIWRHSKRVIQLAKNVSRQATRQRYLSPACTAKLIQISSLHTQGGSDSVGPLAQQAEVKSFAVPCTSSSVKIKDVQCTNDILEITWDDNITDRFPYVWLRDCCLCPECYTYTSKARSFVMQHLDPDIRPDSIAVDDSSCMISITWQGGHVSEFGFDWLHKRAFNNNNRKIRQKWLPPAFELWGRKDMEGNIPSDTLENIMNDDKALFNFLFEMEKKGIYKFTAAPLEVGQLEKVAERVSIPRVTNYGVTFHVQVKADASNAAYTSVPLGMHTDVPFYEYLPGVWMTHCIKQYEGEGGSSLVTDGLYVAEKMRRERPDLFEILATTPIDYYDVGHDHYRFYLLKQAPIIRLDQHGSVNEIAYNNQDRDYYLDLPPEKVKPLYTALRYWDDMMYREENHLVFKLEEGEIIALDNRRVLHGRTGFGTDGQQSMERHLEGIYFDRDEVSSRRRVLQYDLGLDEHPPIY